MRYLNRIIFINSANVPYADIRLDGNVHFIGTQGVGKSTLLRAILFFYNADKMKLGIHLQQGQKPFEDFYLAHPDSYIIYEVQRENGLYFIMLFQSQGRAAFRFIDTAFKKEYLVDEHNNVEYEWGKISQRIGAKVFKSNIIRAYEQYRDIIYGNKHNVPRELQRFSIMESSKYKNVYQTIQNIFLNQSLESRVIKDIIIDSMDFADDAIDLNFYRDHVKDFQQQYDDISKWYKKDKNGSVRVRTDAQKVIDQYGIYQASRKTIAELCANINYALDRDREALPGLSDNIVSKDKELRVKKAAAADEAEKYNKQRDALNQKDGALKDILDRTRRKHQHYAEINIDNIAECMSHESEWKTRRSSLQTQIDQLSGQNMDVKVKYDMLRQQADNSLQQQTLEIRQRMAKREQEASKSKEQLSATYVTHRAQTAEKYRSLRQSSNDRLNGVLKEQNDLRLKAMQILQGNPYAQEMAEERANIKQLGEDSARLHLESAKKQREIDRITNEANMKRKELETEADKDIADIERQRQQVLEESARLQRLLDRQKGSFAEWLGDNVKGWEKNIGKVVDEESVLYNTSLSPTLEDKGKDSLFGVKIDTGAIDRKVRTPKDIADDKAKLDGQAEALQKKIVNRRLQLQKDIDEMEVRPSSLLKELRGSKVTIDAEAQAIPSRLKVADRALQELEDKLAEYRKRLTDENQKAMADVQERLDKLTTEAAQLKQREESELEKLEKSFARDKKSVEKALADDNEALENDIAALAESTKKQKHELDAQMDRELKGLGIDISKLADLRQQLQEMESKLKQLDEDREKFVAWKNDKKEYFDHEQENKDARKVLHDKIEALAGKFAERKRHLDAAINSLQEELQKLHNNYDALQQGIEKVEGFMASASWTEEMQSAGRRKTVKSLSEIYDKLNVELLEQQSHLKDFKDAVNRFKSNFSPQNTFHFRTQFESDKDYIDFAADLSDFVSNDKIEQYRQRVSENYAGILSRISKEVSDLMNHNSQIQGTINDINRDFKQNNFVGVIKDIELKADESNDRIMQHLLSIRRFGEEHQMDIGQLNLFTNEVELDKNNAEAVDLLMTLMQLLEAEQQRDTVRLADTFRLVFRVKENDNDTGWVERLANVGSDGTDILVKAMVNIMLINVFKQKVSRKFGDFRLHCMMDEIGRLHPDNVAGILDFANKRNIYLINSSPTTYNATAYRYTYSLSKDDDGNTVARLLLSVE